MSTINDETIRTLLHREPGVRLVIYPAHAQRLGLRIVAGDGTERGGTGWTLTEALIAALEGRAAPRSAAAMRELVDIVERLQAADAAFLTAHGEDRYHDADRARDDRDAALDALRGFWDEKQHLVREGL